jgi:hypothetical protein
MDPTIRTRPTKPRTAERTMTKVRCRSEDSSFEIPEAIGKLETLRLGLCAAKVAEVDTAVEEKLLVELEVFEFMTDRASVVFVVVTDCGKAVGETTEAVIVVEATGAAAGRFAPFGGGPARTRTGGAGGDARASNGNVKIPKRAVPVPRMSRI